MELCFKPIKKEYLGVGTLPNGYFDQINEWKPLTKYLESGAKNYPEKLMFKIGNSDGKIIEEYSYLETNQKSNQVANGLIDFGIKKGDKVGMYMLNCAEFVFSILGTHKTGGVQVPINKDEKGERLAYVINYSEMQALVVDLSGLPLIEEIADKLTNLKIIYIVAGSETIPQNIGEIKVSSFVDLYKFTDQNPGIEIKIGDQERCMFTSGTTGMPKGVVREHGGVVMTVRSYLQYQGIRSEDILMSVLSLGHANAQAMCLFTSIGAGATAVFFPKFSASNFFKWANDCGATVTNFLGAVSEYLWSSKVSDFDKKHSIRTVLAGPAPKNVIAFEKRFNLKIVEGYGSTEMGMPLWKNPEDQASSASWRYRPFPPSKCCRNSPSLLLHRSPSGQTASLRRPFRHVVAR